MSAIDVVNSDLKRRVLEIVKSADVRLRHVYDPNTTPKCDKEYFKRSIQYKCGFSDANRDVEVMQEATQKQCL